MAKNKSAKALTCTTGNFDHRLFFAGNEALQPKVVPVPWKGPGMGDPAGAAKIVSDALTGNVPGVHPTGPHATDLVTDDARGER